MTPMVSPVTLTLKVFIEYWIQVFIEYCARGAQQPIKSSMRRNQFDEMFYGRSRSHSHPSSCITSWQP